MTRGRAGQRALAHMILNGGMGAAQRRDGLSTTAYPWNSVVTSSEVFENNAPVLIERKELIPESAGQGRRSGGMGQRLVLRPADERPLTVNLRPVNLRHPPQGLMGGKPGALGRILFNGELTDQRLLSLRLGDDLVCELAGGGGFGALQV